MKEFLHRHAEFVTGVLSGFDRVLFRGTQRMLANTRGLMAYLWSQKVLLKEFGKWAEELTEQVRRAGQRVMREQGREVPWLGRCSADKEARARQIAERDGVRSGPVCLLEAQELFMGYELRRDRESKRLVLEPRTRQCVHQYHYLIHPQLGWMHVRVQTWLPFTVRVCLNGREWLCRELVRRGIGFERRENCLSWVSDVSAAQQVLDEQLKTDWVKLLNKIAHEVNPALKQLLVLEGSPLAPYWSIEQSEWATDVMFKDAASLGALYPRLVHQGITTLGCCDVLRFLGQKVSVSGRINGNLMQEVSSDLKRRPEGVRLKHKVGVNSVKMYDKQGSVLRVETTINDPSQFKVWRGTEAEPKKKAMRKVRKSVADARRRAAVSQACNNRYLSALSSMPCDATVAELLVPLSQPVISNGRRYRGLRLLEHRDGELLSAISQGQWSLNGFRNADVRQQLDGPDPHDKAETRKRAARVSRQLALLRAHGLIRRVAGTNRWMISAEGRRVATLLTIAKSATANKLLEQAA